MHIAQRLLKPQPPGLLSPTLGSFRVEGGRPGARRDCRWAFESRKAWKAGGLEHKATSPAEKDIKCWSSRGEGPRFDPDDYVEAVVHTVRQTKVYGNVIYLKLHDGKSSVLPVYVGYSESVALLSVLNSQDPVRPLSYDLFRSTLKILGYKVKLVRITSLVGNTYHARVHIQPSGRSQEMEIDVDARPSDALNLALRFNAPIYVHRQLAAEMGSNAQLTDNLTSQEVIQSCREEMLCHHDPTVLLKLQLQIAIRSEQYVEAARVRDDIDKLLATHRPLRLLVSLESALEGHRFEEAVFLRDELHRLRTLKQFDSGGQGLNQGA